MSTSILSRARSSARPSFATKFWGATLAMTLAVGGLTAAVTGVTLVAAPSSASAAAAPAFDCTDPRFFAQAEATSGKADLYEGRYKADGTSDWGSPISSTSGANLYNALAFNPVDEYLYGTVYAAGGGTAGSFVRINRSGVATNLGVSSPALGSSYSTLWDSGEFDSSGNYYVASGNAGANPQNNIRKISGLAGITGTGGTRPTLQTIPLSLTTARFADLSFKAGYLWAANYGKSSTIYRIDVNGISSPEGTVKSFTVPTSVLPTESYGSGFTMTNGNLAFISTESHMVQIAVADPTSATPTFEQVSTVAAPNNSKSDATNCSTAPKAHLSVTKTGPATVVAGAPITWHLTVLNEGPGTSSGFVLTDILPAGLSNVAATSADSGCVVNAAKTSIICNGGRLFKDATASVTVTANAPTTIGAIVNQAKVVGNEDDDPDDPISVPTTVTLATRAGDPVSLPVPGGITGPPPTTSVEGGTVVYDSEGGTITYTPPVGFSGVDSYGYTDSNGNPVTVNITVAPDARDDTDATSVNVPVTTTADTLLGNDVGINLAVTAVGSPTHGTVRLVAGDAVFAPATDYFGPASYSYTISGDGGTDTATVNLTVAAEAVNAVNDTAGTTTGTPVTVPSTTLLVNDDGTGLAVTGVGSPTHGTVQLVDGDPVFTPTPGYYGPASFGYTITGDGGTDTATVTVTVSPVAPAALDDTATTPAGEPLTISADDLLDNDSGTDIAVTSVGNPSHGTVTLVDGDPAFTPASDYFGPASFDYTITGPGGATDTATVTIAVTAAAVAAHDDTASTTTDEPVTVTSATMLGNDDGTHLSVTGVFGAVHGTVQLVGGDAVFTPTPGYYGPALFQYTITGDGGTGTAIVAVTVTPVAPSAAGDTAGTQSGVPVTIPAGDLLNNDSGTNIALTAVGNPTHGTIDAVGGDPVFTPDDGYYGPATFDYTITGPGGATSTATVTVTVSPVAPDAVDDTASTHTGSSVTIPVDDLLDNDGGTDVVVTSVDNPLHGTVDLVDGDPVFTPDDGYHGPASFDYTITGPGGATSTATVTVTVSPVAPDAVDDTASTQQDHAVTVPTDALLDNDSGTDVTLTSVGNPSHGTVDLVDGDPVFTPDDGYHGTASFDYTITGPGGATSTATVTITVTEAPPPPIATADSTSTVVGTAKTVQIDDLLSNDIGTGLAITAISTPAHGVAALSGTGSVVYTPAPGFSGIDTFTYTVTDANRLTAIGTVTVTVTPLARPDSGITIEGQAVRVTLPKNDLGTGLWVSANTPPADGKVTISSNGVARYTPAGGFVGTDTFEYTVTDQAGQTTQGTVTIRVSPTALAFTGSQPLAPALLALLLLLVGIGASAYARNRRRGRHV